MDQKERNKIASVLAVVFGMVLIYLLAVNVFKVGKKNPRAVTSPAVTASGSLSSPSPDIGPVQHQAPVAVLEPNVLAEQQKIAARLPRRNPFCAVQTDYSLPAPRSGMPLTVNADNKIKVSAIMSRPGANKRIAMINGKMVEEGDRIGEWTILKVNAKNVVLDNGAQQMVVGVK